MCAHVEVCSLTNTSFRICPRLNSYPEWYCHLILSFCYLIPIFNRALPRRRVQNDLFFVHCLAVLLPLWLPSGLFSVRIFHRLQQLFVEMDGMRVFLGGISERGRWDKDDYCRQYRLTKSIVGINFLNYFDNLVFSFRPYNPRIELCTKENVGGSNEELSFVCKSSIIENW